jgi:hypothetical protein
MKTYLAEFNNPKGPIKKIAEQLMSERINSRVVDHPTSLVLHKPNCITFYDLKRILKKQLRPQVGSLIISSKQTGRAFVVRMRGNRSGKFVRLF